MEDRANSIRLLKEQALLPKVKKTYKIPKVSSKKRALMGNGALDTETDLDKWFKQKMKSPKICENCGTRLSSLSEIDWKGSQHHILEKSLFPSVKTHELNHLVLGRWCCHPKWHESMGTASKMLIFPYAKRKVQMFIGEVLEYHKNIDWFK